ncbi:MAG: hypothetical protein P1P69_03200 [Methanosarcinaceae archaeon]|nr:hypothetical protein [Methanosarcinaceae archaeon]
MDGKTILLIISVVAVGMFVLPSTLALYTGQHDFVNGTQVDCGKCHASDRDNIARELANGSAHMGMTCKSCHYGISGGNEVDVVGNDTSTVTAHAAGVAINCIGCHSYPGTGGYNETSTKDYTGSGITGVGVNVSKELAMSGEAHKYLTNATTSTGGINDRDLACVACHTKVAVNFTGTDLNAVLVSENITLTKDDGNNNWMYANVD